MIQLSPLTTDMNTTNLLKLARREGISTHALCNYLQYNAA